jgi:tetratricopeptide (TPR) repeat protein
LIARHSWAAGLLVIIFLFTFFQFIVQPYQADRLVISAVIEKNPDERLALYEKVLTTSAMGKYQLRTFMGQQTEEFIRSSAETLSVSDAKKELDLVIGKLEESMEESPLDLKASLRLAYLYNIYGTGDPEKFDLAEKYGKMSIDLSPTNQQGYWVLAQTKLYKQEFNKALNLAQQAIDLEPRNFQAHEIALQIAQRARDQEAILRILKQALEINPEWQTELNSILGNEKETTSSENQE